MTDVRVLHASSILSAFICVLCGEYSYALMNLR